MTEEGRIRPVRGTKRGNMFRFLHAADIHLDSPLKGLARYEGAPAERVRNASRRALERLVETAVGARVAFVLLAGDLYDGDWPDYNTGLFFASQLAELRRAGIPVVLIAGNHDAQNRMTRSLRLPEGVALLSAEAPETIVLDKPAVAIHGQSFAMPAVEENLALRYPDPRKGLFNIGLLHTSVAGQQGHDPYAPCTLEDLRTRQYDYWALGHIHRRAILCNDPPIAYAGNVQGRHIRESGAKGCLLVTVDDARSVSTEFVPLDVLRWETVILDAGSLATADELPPLVERELRTCWAAAEGRALAVRVEVHGPTPAHGEFVAERAKWTNEVRAAALHAGRGEAWVEKVCFATTAPLRTAGQESADGAWGELHALIEELRNDPAALAEMGGELGELARRLPAELRDGPEGARLDDPAWLATRLGEVEPLLRTRLQEEG